MGKISGTERAEALDLGRNFGYAGDTVNGKVHAFVLRNLIYLAADSDTVICNTDDDNGNNIPDRDEPEVIGENDLVRVHFGFSVSSESLRKGRVVIERANDSIRLWKKETKGEGQEIVFDEDNRKAYDLSDSASRTEFENDVRDRNLWAEGSDNGVKALSVMLENGSGRILGSDEISFRANEVDIAFTFDDGPHEPLSGKTVSIINTLNTKEESLNKDIKVTFFVEHSRITSDPGKTILRDYMCGNGHEIGLHGVHETTHHMKHQNTPDLPTRIMTMKNLIASAEAGGITPIHIRPPGGWGGWTEGDEYNKTQLTPIYTSAGLARYVGGGTNGVDSWGLIYPSNRNTPPTAAQRTAFINAIKGEIDTASSGTASKLVILMHDLRDPDRDDIGNIIDETEAYAKGKGVTINYKTLKEMGQ